ncbi:MULTISPECIES: NAD(P)H-binding protein [Nocardia]|uniref:Nucleotide-diphosphate-sugar epimerase n=1 Tax=Nocardia sputorum TaxID=2984338 RepID=A0ABM8CZJ9_9NOCA|nr:NAD(P)H-binding protein [Nocardia sputorum]BDU00498.1 nucleotide-diphosphate-sugar epimerase [Nocardia sputorum]
MTILVTGATANIGRKVVDHLLELGATDIRALTNNPRKAALPAAVQVAEGYLRRPDTLPAALSGVERMYLAPTPDSVTEVLALARAAGVRHVVDLSGEPESWWGSVCTAVEDSGLAWTHLWPGDFMENTLIWSRQIRETGAVLEPRPDAASAPIAMDDIAAVAATTLLSDTHLGRAYPLAGPEILTRTDLVRHLAEALGRDITFRQSTREDTIAALTPTMGDTATWYVDNVLTSFDVPPQALPVTSVQDVTGRPATTFARWAADNAPRFTAD